MKQMNFFSMIFLWKNCLKIILVWKSKVIKFLIMKKKNENEPLEVTCPKIKCRLHGTNALC